MLMCVVAFETPDSIGVFGVIGLLGLSVVLSGIIMKARNVAAITYTVLTWTIMFLGLILVLIAILMSTTPMMAAAYNLEVPAHRCRSTHCFVD